jgi:hypothetical protein
MQMQKGTREPRPGIYFNRATNEIRRVMDTDGSLGAQWEYITGDVKLRLLAIREILKDRGLGDDPKRAYWYMPAFVVQRTGTV